MTPYAPTTGLAVTVAMLLHGCTPAPPTPNPHYTVGVPYQANGVWHYPRENFDLNETGLAAVAKASAPRLTADGELFDSTALAAGHSTLQLPAIARVTNLENGRMVTLRINDRGSGNPRRLIEVTSRTATLLDMPADGVARVQVQVLANESHAAADSLPGAPSLGMKAAPRDGIQVAELAPLPGARSSAPHPLVAFAGAAANPTDPGAQPPTRMPEAVFQTEPRPGRLMVRLDTFDEFQYAAVQQAKLAAFGAQIVYLKEGRKQRYRVDVGPLPDVARADAVLDRAFALGIPDARIVVD